MLVDVFPLEFTCFMSISSYINMVHIEVPDGLEEFSLVVKVIILKTDIWYDVVVFSPTRASYQSKETEMVSVPCHPQELMFPTPCRVDGSPY